jgi:chaperonin GroES
VAKAKKKAAKKSVAPKKKKTLKSKAKPKKPAKAARPAQKKSKAPKKSAKMPIAKNPAKKSINFSQVISPLDDRILIRLESRERVTAGGLILPETADISGNLRGEVVAVGRGHRDSKGRLRPMELKIGDRILLNEYSGSKVTILGEELIMLRESDVLGILET